MNSFTTAFTLQLKYWWREQLLPEQLITPPPLVPVHNFFAHAPCLSYVIYCSQKYMSSFYSSPQGGCVASNFIFSILDKSVLTFGIVYTLADFLPAAFMAFSVLKIGRFCQSFFFTCLAFFSDIKRVQYRTGIWDTLSRLKYGKS